MAKKLYSYRGKISRDRKVYLTKLHRTNKSISECVSRLELLKKAHVRAGFAASGMAMSLSQLFQIGDGK